MPQFVLDGYLPQKEFENPTWNGKPACFDWQNWKHHPPESEYGGVVKIDIYQHDDDCNIIIPASICIDNPLQKDICSDLIDI